MAEDATTGTPRLTGARWWDADAARHAADAPRHCPGCGAAVAQGLVVEYWTGEDRVFHCWCRSCGWAGDVVRTERVIGHEAE